MVKIPKVLSGWVVLVVDDEEDSLEVARLLLQKAGANVFTATNGQEAINQLQHNKPHFILSDLSMPEITGWQLIEQLNRDRVTSNIPAIALTAHAMPGDREKAIAAGFLNYITKPLDPEKFIQHLLTLLVEVPELQSMLAPQ